MTGHDQTAPEQANLYARLPPPKREEVEMVARAGIDHQARALHRIVSASVNLERAIADLQLDEFATDQLHRVLVVLECAARDLEVDLAATERSIGVSSLRVVGADGLLTRSEQRVLPLIARRISVAEISRRLFMSRNTVKSHVQGIYRKVGVRSREELLQLIYDDDGLALVSSSQSPGYARVRQR